MSVITSEAISTSGDNATGILAQSVGGGGGNGGFSVAGSGSIIASLGVGGVNVSGDLTGGTSIDVVLGASGTGSGNGNNVAIVATGNNITTYGDRSSGILAQSIGGGGGVGWVSVAGGVQANNAKLTLGGQNGGSGDGGLVTIQNLSGIWVGGNGSYGILAQSIGGGGGLGYNAALTPSSKVILGGAANTSGNGGQVAVNNSGSITTGAAGGYGIIAQSIGGGGLAGYAGGVASAG